MMTNDVSPQLALQQLIQGFQVTQCIYVAAKLYASSEKLRSEPRRSTAWHQASEMSCRGDSANKEEPLLTCVLHCGQAMRTSIERKLTMSHPATQSCSTC